MLSPHTPGTEWIASRHGVVIQTSDEADRLYADTGFARFCERWGVPTGTLVPQRAYELAERAYGLQPRWDSHDLDALPRAAAERDAARAGMMEAAVAMCRPVAVAAE